MSPAANTRATHSLEDLRTALQRFGAESLRSLDAAARDIQHTLDWLAARQRHWQDRVQRYQEQMSRSQAALSAGHVSMYYDPQTGTAYAPNPSVYEMALVAAQGRLQTAEAELRNVQEWARAVQQAAAGYQSEALRLAALVQADLPKAMALLSVSTGPSPPHVLMDTPHADGAGGPTFRRVRLSSTAARFDSAWKTLSQRWDATRVLWDAAARSRFEEEHWAPLAGQVGATWRALEQLMEIIRQAERSVK